MWIWCVDMLWTRASSIGTRRSVEQTSMLPRFVSMPTAPPTTRTGFTSRSGTPGVSSATAAAASVRDATTKSWAWPS